jgi:hypothetical protein
MGIFDRDAKCDLREQLAKEMVTGYQKLTRESIPQERVSSYSTAESWAEGQIRLKLQSSEEENLSN